MNWKDTSSDSLQESTLYLPAIDISVHRHDGVGSWLATCQDVRMESANCETQDLAAAQRRAVDMVKARVAAYSRSLVLA